MAKELTASKTYLFEEAPPLKAIATMAIPTVVNQLVTVVYNLADTFFIGRINNPSMLAGVSVAAPLMMMLTALGNLFSVGGCSLIARALGAQNERRARNVFSLSVLIAASIGIFITFLNIFFCEPIARLAGSSETSLAFTVEYSFWAVGMNAIPTLCSLAIGSSLRGRGFSKNEMFGLTLGNVTNVILDPIFIFVFNMGVKGAAVATFISSCLSLVYFVIFSIRLNRTENIYTRPGKEELDRKLIPEIITTGLPATINTLLTSIGNTLYLNAIKGYSDSAVAAAGVVRKIERSSGQVCIGINQGTIPLISYNYAQKNKDRMEDIRKKTLAVGIIWGLIAMSIFLIFPGFLVGLFIKDSATISYGKILMRISAFIPGLMCYNNAQRTVLQGLGKKKQSIRISLGRQIFFYLPSLFVLNYFFGMVGAAAAQPVADLFSDISTYIKMRKLWPGILRTMDEEPEPQKT